MTMLAAHDYVSATHTGAGLMHIEPGSVIPADAGISAWGEPLPAYEAEETAATRIETRFSLYLSADDYLAGLWDALAYWEETDPSSLPTDVIRWHTITCLLMMGGPDSPAAHSNAASARAAAGTPEFAQACAAVKRAFGVTIA